MIFLLFSREREEKLSIAAEQKENVSLEESGKLGTSRTFFRSKGEGLEEAQLLR